MFSSLAIAVDNYMLRTLVYPADLAALFLTPSYSGSSISSWHMLSVLRHAGTSAFSAYSRRYPQDPERLMSDVVQFVLHTADDLAVLPFDTVRCPFSLLPVVHWENQIPFPDLLSLFSLRSRLLCLASTPS